MQTLSKLFAAVFRLAKIFHKISFRFIAKICHSFLLSLLPLSVSFPRRRESSAVLKGGENSLLDSRLRGNDIEREWNDTDVLGNCALRMMQKFLSHLAIIGLVFNPIVALADLPITPDGSTNTQVTKTSTGIDQINIAAPNSAGLSHNKFTDYNVNPSGQVINNFSGANGNVVGGNGGSAVTNTVIGGLVVANPNLVSAGREATIIMNEVTSTNNSQLLGYTEIAGGNAKLIISNPNGIFCSGCGFINTSQLGLIAGRSNIDANGNISSFDLSAGSASTNLAIPLITIEGLGLDATTTSYTDIIASSVKLIGGIYGSDDTQVNIKTGDDTYNYSSGNVTSSSSGSSTPALNSSSELFAIDASNLGAIQAGRIFLVATKAGLGVNMTGSVIANKEINIDTQGNIYYTTIASETSNIAVKSNNGGVTGKDSNSIIKTFGATASVNVQASGEIVNQGTFESNSITATSGGNFTNSGNIISSDNISITSTLGNILNSGNILSYKDLTITSNTGNVTNSNNITASETLTLNANLGDILNSSNSTLGYLALENSDSSTTEILTQNLNLNSKNIANFGGIIASSSKIISDQITNSSTIYTTNSLDITANILLNNSGTIETNNFNILNSTDISNSGTMRANNNFTANLLNLTNLEDGIIYTVNDANISATNNTSEINNYGQIIALNKVTITNDSGTTNNYSDIFSNSALEIISKNLSNSGYIGSGESVGISSANQITNSGLIESEQVNITDSVSLTNSGTINSNQLIISITASLNNNTDDNGLGTLNGYASSSITSKDLTNSGTITGSDQKLYFTDNGSLTNSGIIESTSSLSIGNILTAANLFSLNNSGSITADSTLTIKSSGVLTNTETGIIASISDLNITSTASLTNSKRIFSYGDVSINSNNLTNSNSGQIFSDQDLTFNTEIFTNYSQILSNSDLIFNDVTSLANSGTLDAYNITANNTNNSSTFTNTGQIQSENNIQLATGSLNNSNNIISGYDLTIDAITGSVTNNKLLQASNNIIINAATLNNSATLTSGLYNSPLILASRNLAINALTISNENTKPTTSSSTFTSGIAASGDVNLNGTNINNDSGIIRGANINTTYLDQITSSTAEDSEITTSSGLLILSNDFGEMLATIAINIDLDEADYTITGTYSAADYVDITAKNIINLGNITAIDYIKLTATEGSVINGVESGDNSNIKLESGSIFEITANTFITNYATLISNSSMTISANSDLNNYGDIMVKDALNVNVSNNLNNNSSALIWAGGDAILNVGNNLTNTSAAIYSIGNLTMQKNDSTDSLVNKMTSLENISGEIGTESGDLTIRASSFENKRLVDVVDERPMTPTIDNVRISKTNKDWTFVSSWGFGSSGTAWDYVSTVNENSNSQSATIYSGAKLTFETDKFNNNLSEIYSTSNIEISYSESFDNLNLNTFLETLYYRVVWDNGGYRNDYFVRDRTNHTRSANVGENLSQLTDKTFLSYIKSGGSLTLTKNGTTQSDITNGNNVRSAYVEPNDLDKYGNTPIDSITPAKLLTTGIIEVDLSGILSVLGDISSDESSSSAVSGNEFSTTEISEKVGSVSSSDSIASSTINSGLFKINKDKNPNKPLVESRSQFTNFSEFYGSDYFYEQLGISKQLFLDAERASINAMKEGEYKATIRMLGDSFVETKLITQQLEQIRKDALLLSNDETRTNAEIKRLIDNAVEEKTRLNLDISKGLTTDQINSLDKDIVWFEATSINGQFVIVPKIYLSLETRNKLLGTDATKSDLSDASSLKDITSGITSTTLGNGSLATGATMFAKGSLTINSPTANLTNNGSIISRSGDVNINVGSISSVSNSFAKASIKALTISTDSSGLTSGGNVNITANSGNILLQNTILSSQSKLSLSTLSSSGNISIINDSKASSTNNLSSLFAKKSALGLSATSTSGFASLDSLGFATSSGLSTSSSLSTSSTESDAAAARASAVFNAGTDIEINSSGNINIANNYLNTGGSIYMTADGDINNSNYIIQASNNVIMDATNVNNISTATSANKSTISETRIEADNMVSINATKDADGNGGNITNIGATIKAGELLYLTAENNITNKALIEYKINGRASYSSGLTSSQTAEDFTNTTLDSTGTSASDTNLLTSNASRIRSTLLNQGTLSSGGNLVLVAGNNINNIGSNITSTDASYLEATAGDINITTAALRDRTVTSGGSKKKAWTSTTDNTTNLQSNITSGGDLDIAAISDSINIKGSNITSSDNLTLTAKNDITIESAQDTTYSFSAGRTGRGKSYLNKSSSTTQVESNLTTTNNGNISITSGSGNTDTIGAEGSKGSIAIIASNLNTKDSDADSSNNTGSGNIALTARSGVNISSAENTFYSESSNSKKGRTVSKSSQNINQTVTNVESDIIASNDLTITAFKDINITASNLTSGNDSNAVSGNLSIIAGKYLDTITESESFNSDANVNIYAALDKSYSFSETKKSSLNYGALAVSLATTALLAANTSNIGGGLGSSIAMQQRAYGAYSNSDVDRNSDHWLNSKEKYDETIVSSDLKSKGSLNIYSGSDINIASSNLSNSSVSQGGSTTSDITLTAGKILDKDNNLQNINDDAKANILTMEENHYSKEINDKRKLDLKAVVATSAISTTLSGMGLAGIAAADKTDNQRDQIAVNQNYSSFNNSNVAQISSNIAANNDLNITSNSDLTIQGSNLSTSLGDVNLTSVNGGVIIASAIESSSSESEFKKQDFKDVDTSLNRGRASLDFTASRGETTTRSTSLTQKSSNITAGYDAASGSGNLNILGKSDVNILASNLAANNETSITSSEGNVNILAQANTYTTSMIDKNSSLTLSAGAGNAFVDTAYAVDDLVKAAKAIVEAKKELNHMETLRNNGQANETAVKDAKLNLTIALLNYELTGLKVAAAAAKSAESTKTLGFYADLQMRIATSKFSSNSSSVDNVASNINSGGNVVIKSGLDLLSDDTSLALGLIGNTTITGSNIASNNGDINITSKNNTNINASQDTYSYSSRSESYTTNLTLVSSSVVDSTAGRAIQALENALTIAIGKSKTASDIHQSTYNNTQLTAESGTIKINSIGVTDAGSTSGGDTTISGANLLASNIILNTGRDLTVESLQNSYNLKSKSSSFGLSAGANSLGFSISNSKTSNDRLWVDNQSSIIGSDSVTINTGSNTDIKGAIIANITNTGDLNNGNGLAGYSINSDTLKGAIDGSNLTLNTASLTFSNLFDHNYSKTTGYHIGITIGAGSSASNTATSNGAPAAITSISTPENSTQQNSYFPKGSLTLGLQNSSSKKEQTTFATIGKGNISTNTTLTFDSNGDLATNTGGTTNDAAVLANLNRDITKSQVITRDQITGALNINTTLDLRLFSTEGRKEIEKEVFTLAHNLVVSATAASAGIKDVVTSFGDIDSSDAKNDSYFEVLTNKQKLRTDALFNLQNKLKASEKANYYNNPNDAKDGYRTEDGQVFINLATAENQSEDQQNQFLLKLTLHEPEHGSPEYNSLSKEAEEILVRNYQAKATDQINFYHGLGDYADSALSNFVSDAYANSSVGDQYSLSSNYLNNLYSNGTKNVTASSIAANNKIAQNVDPNKIEAYQKDVHKYLTTFLAENAGFTHEEAMEIARGDYRVDTKWNKQPLTSDSIMWLLGQGHPKEDYHFVSQGRLTEMKDLAYQTGDMRLFGEYLHALQDSYSHQKEGITYDPTWGHSDINIGQWFTSSNLGANKLPINQVLVDDAVGEFGAYVDRTYNRPDLADQMAKSTYTEMQNFLQYRNREFIDDVFAPKTNINLSEEQQTSKNSFYNELKEFYSNKPKVQDNWNSISDRVKEFNRLIEEDNDKKGQSLFR